MNSNYTQFYGRSFSREDPILTWIYQVVHFGSVLSLLINDFFLNSSNIQLYYRLPIMLILQAVQEWSENYDSKDPSKESHERKCTNSPFNCAPRHITSISVPKLNCFSLRLNHSDSFCLLWETGPRACFCDLGCFLPLCLLQREFSAFS